MIICHCSGKSHRDIEAAARDGARCERDVAERCSAGAGCGGCREAILALLSAHQRQPEPQAPHRSAS